ncbi:MAG: formylglycine-generating enzyme family protein, partial [Planctomycetia bacterium]
MIFFQLLHTDCTLRRQDDWADDLSEAGVPAGVVATLKKCFARRGRRLSDTAALLAEFTPAAPPPTLEPAVPSPRPPVQKPPPAPMVPPPKAATVPPPAVVPSAPSFPFSAEEAKDYQRRYAAWCKQPLELTNSLGMKLVLIPPGRFLMGSPTSEKERRNNENQEDVTLTKPFYLGVYEVTQKEYRAVTASNPSSFKKKNWLGFDVGDEERNPVENVSYEDALAFVAKLNGRDRGKLPTGWKYMLPTEAQWEYACRAGSNTVFSFGDVLNGDKANCDGNRPYGTEKKGRYLERPAPVGSYAPNGLGLYDMHGNV